MDIVTLIFSSAIVSGIVTVSLSYIFDSKKYIRDKRFNIYTEFLGQLDKTLPVEFPEPAFIAEYFKKMEIEALKLEKNLQEVRLVSKDKRLENHLEKLSELIENRLYRINEFQISTDKADREKIRKTLNQNNKKIELVTKCVIGLMKEEIFDYPFINI